MSTPINLYSKRTFDLPFSEARWLYDMGMHETLTIRDRYDWVGEIFCARRLMDNALGAPLGPGPKI